jgi:predicted dehydrogenase
MPNIAPIVPPITLALVGAGFWAPYQLAAWGELDGHRLVAVCDPVRERAETLAAAAGVAAAYDDVEEMLVTARPAVVDIVTPPETHAQLARLAIAHGCAVICQKPLAPSLADAVRIVEAADAAGRPLLVHENFRWQAPMRALRALLDEDRVGRPFRSRIQFSCSFPVFDNQPALRDASRFILLDLGTHHLDLARFLFGEVERLFCRTARVDPRIRGEDVATVLLDHGSVHTTVELSYASRLPDERFPETYVLIEAERGSLELGPGYAIRMTTAAGVETSVHPPPRYAWADPAYELVHASMVPCQRHLLAALTGERAAETDGRDNLRTLRLVAAAYESAASGEVVRP